MEQATAAVTPPAVAAGSSHLKRTLGTWAIVGLGLGYMTPTVIFDTFGIVAEETNYLVPLAYLMAMVAMAFTAVSYGRMVQVYPSAGSAYTYASETIHPNVGFVIGWSSLLDYLLLPLVNALILRSYMESFFPDVTPRAVGVRRRSRRHGDGAVQHEQHLEVQRDPRDLRDRPHRRLRHPHVASARAGRGQWHALFDTAALA